MGILQNYRHTGILWVNRHGDIGADVGTRHETWDDPSPPGLSALLAREPKLRIALHRWTTPGLLLLFIMFVFIEPACLWTKYYLR